MPNVALARSRNARWLPALISDYSSETIGPLKDVQAALQEIFPDLKWGGEPARYKLMGVTLTVVVGFGRKQTVALQQVGEGDVLFLSVESKKKEDIERVAERLGLRVIDKRHGSSRA